MENNDVNYVDVKIDILEKEIARLKEEAEVYKGVKLFIDQLQEEKRELIEMCERLAKEYLHAVQDIEGFAHDNGEDMQVTGSRETLTAHYALISWINGE